MKSYNAIIFSNAEIIYPDSYSFSYKNNVSKENKNIIDSILLNIHKIEKIEFYFLKAFIYNDKVEIILLCDKNGSVYSHERIFEYDLFYLEDNVLYEFCDEIEKNIFMRKKKIENFYEKI